MGLPVAELKGLCTQAFDQSNYANLVDMEMKKRWKMNRADLDNIRTKGRDAGNQAYSILTQEWKKQDKGMCKLSCKLFHKRLCCDINWGRLGCDNYFNKSRYVQGWGYRHKKYKASDPKKHRRCNNEVAARCSICREGN